MKFLSVLAESTCIKLNKLLFFLFTALYIGFCHSFDIMSNTPRKIYYLATTIGETRTMCKLNSYESKDNTYFVAPGDLIMQ